MFQKQLLLYGTFVAPQILFAYGFNGSDLPGEVIDDDETPIPPILYLHGVQGQRFWRIWQEREGDDPPPRRLNPPYASFFDVHLEVASFTGEQVDLPHLLETATANDQERQYATAWAVWPEHRSMEEIEVFHRPDNFGPTWAYVDGQEGAFVDAKPINLNNLPGGMEYSELVWRMWKATVRRTTGCDDYSGLEFFMIPNIKDTTTQQIISAIVSWKQADPGIPLRFEPDNRSPNNCFWALIGSTYGEQLMNMLTNNKEAMEGKTIMYIEILYDFDVSSDEEVTSQASDGELEAEGEPIYTMWAVFSQM